MTLQEQMRNKIAVQGKSRKTFETYWKYCESYLRFLKSENGVWVHPSTVGREEIEQWLTMMATKLHCSKNTQNTALQSVLYLYREILGISIENVSAMRAKRPQMSHQVMSVEEISALFGELSGVDLLAAQLMYGCGLRISDVVSLRWKDVSFDRKQLAIKSGKGDKWRYTSFPIVLHEPMLRQLESVKVLWKHDQKQNPNGVALPGRYRYKCPSAAMDLRWYWVFPSDNLSKSDDGVLCRWHRDQDHLGRKISQAGRRAGILSRVTSHMLRASYATHAHEQGVPMRTLMELLGHNSIETTEIYVQADQHKATASRSPLESILANPPVPKRDRLRVVVG